MLFRSREHVVDGVVTHMTHMEFAAGVRQHRTGVVLLLGATVFICCVFDYAVCVSLGPSGLRGALDLGMVVFILHGEWSKPLSRQGNLAILGLALGHKANTTQACLLG